MNNSFFLYSLHAFWIFLEATFTINALILRACFGQISIQPIQDIHKSLFVFLGLFNEIAPTGHC